MTSVLQAPRAPRETRPVLGILRELFERLHLEGIRYCHWKSNEHLDASLIGRTDVDVLVDRSAIVPLTRLLGDAGYKRFVVKAGLGYPGIEDYVGFDRDSGALTHLHVHYQLTLGEKFLKGHRLPWEELYLSTRVLDEERGVFVADPHLELVVLVLRAAMKLRARDFVIEAAGKPYFRGGLAREFRWLASRVRPADAAELATRLAGARVGAEVPAMITAGRPSLRQLVAIRRTADPPLREYRLYGGGEAARHALGRELSLVWWKLRNWYRGAPTRSTRTLPQGGLLVACLGADGAGKSTVVGEIAEWLAHEVAVVTTYGGNGKGSAGWPRAFMQSLGALRRRLRGTRSRPAAAPDVSAPSPQEVSFARSLWVRALARERRARALATRVARGRGMVVISDRWPQSQFPGWNDGPRLDAWLDHPSRWRREAARREREAFRLAGRCPPDLVIKLHVPPDVAARRKPETPAAQLRNGVELLRRLSFPPTTRVIDIDATQPLRQVVLQVKRAIWDAI